MQTTNRKCGMGSKGKKCVGPSALENKPMQSGRAESPTQHANVIPVLIKDGDEELQLVKKFSKENWIFD